jgi:hypothetical protein
MLFAAPELAEPGLAEFEALLELPELSGLVALPLPELLALLELESDGALDALFPLGLLVHPSAKNRYKLKARVNVVERISPPRLFL